MHTPSIDHIPAFMEYMRLACPDDLFLMDAFGCAGGAGAGYSRARFIVVGVELHPHDNYPFPQFQGDAVEAIEKYGHLFDAIHASPPCQRFSMVTRVSGDGNNHPDLIEPTRAACKGSGRPYVIENVVGSPLQNPIRLCGTMFPGLRVLRHRLFETSFDVPEPPHGKHPLVYTLDKRKPHYGKLDDRTAFVQVTGGGNCSYEAAADAMGIDWMTKKELNQAIPPAYTEYIGSYLKEVLA